MTFNPLPYISTEDDGIKLGSMSLYNPKNINYPQSEHTHTLVTPTNH